MPGLWFPPAASFQVRGGPHCGAERRRVARGPESAVAVPILQPGEGNAREPGLPHEDDGTAGAQRGDGGYGGASGALMARARSRQGNGNVRTRYVFWCPVSAVQPTEKQGVPIGSPSDRGQGDSEYAPAGSFRQVDCLGRPAVCGRHGRDARDVVVAEVLGNQRRRNPSVVRCYAALWWLGAGMPKRVA